MRRRIVVYVMLLAQTAALWAIGDAGSAGAASARKQAAHPRGLLFADDFSGTALNRRSWRTCYPWWPANGCTNAGNDELEWYVPGQLRVAGGALHMVAERVATPGVGPGGSAQEFPWRSGMVCTAGRFSFTYGYVTFRARIPAGRGLWPALWLHPADGSWPPEIDVMEAVGENTRKASLTFHPRRGSAVQANLDTRDLSVGWHDFALDWRPGSLTWFVDGAKAFTVTKNVPTQRMYLIMNLAVGGTMPAPPDASTPSPASFDVDRVQVWSRMSAAR